MSVSDSKVTRPALRYHGGKWMLAPWIISHFPEHFFYVEPYAGGASVLLRKTRSKCEIYNDIDEDVTNLFRVLRDKESAKNLCHLLEFTPFGRIDFRDAYEPSIDPVERARRMVVRSFLGFGSGSSNINYSSGFRASSKQSGRPHAMDWANVPECLWAVTERLKGVSIECRDALQIIRKQDDPETLFYIDPPYLGGTRNSSRKQYAFELGVLDHVALGRLLNTIKGKAIVSGYPSELYDHDLFKSWRRIEKETMASGQKGGVVRTEVLWMNF